MRKQRMYFKLLIIGFCLFSTTVWADPQMEVMQDKLDRLEAELALVQRKIYQQPISTSVESVSKPSNIDELYAQIDAQNQVVQSLTSQLEEMSHRLETLSDQLNRMQQDTDFRFNNLNENKPQETNVLPSVPDKIDVSDKEAYDNAYALLKEGNYEQAEQSFLTFMEKYPNSSLLGNANYWLAESYYARQKWAEAAGLFADGFTKYKNNTKAPDSMFKLGLTMKQMNRTKEACTAFKGMIKEFENIADHLKKRADQEIKELKCP